MLKEGRHRTNSNFLLIDEIEDLWPTLAEETNLTRVQGQKEIIQIGPSL